MPGNVHLTHRACQAQFAGRRGAVFAAVPRKSMNTADPNAPRRHPTHMKQWRKFRGLTQEQAAERVEIDRTTYSRIEAGKLPYNQDFLERLALALGCDIPDILSVDPLKPDPPKLVYDRLRRAPPDLQQRALEMLNILLRDVA